MVSSIIGRPTPIRNEAEGFRIILHRQQQDIELIQRQMMNGG